jgi:hypothetical protein
MAPPANWVRRHLGGTRISGEIYSPSTWRGGSIDRFLPLRKGEKWSISCFAWLRSGTETPVSGALTIWDLARELSIGTDFSVGPSWTIVTKALDLGDRDPRNLRIEIYLTTVDTPLHVDSVNAF